MKKLTTMLKQIPWSKVIITILCVVLAVGSIGYEIYEKVSLRQTLNEMNDRLSAEVTTTLGNTEPVGSETPVLETPVSEGSVATPAVTTVQISTESTATEPPQNLDAHSSNDFGNDDLKGTIFVTKEYDSTAMIGQLKRKTTYRVHLRLQNTSGADIENLKLYFPDLKTSILVPDPDAGGSSTLKFTVKYLLGGGRLNG